MLVRFIRTGIPCHLLQVALRSLRILSRDKRVLGPLVTDDALLTLAEAAGLSATRPDDDDASEPDSDFYDNVISSLAREVGTPPCRGDADDYADDPKRERSAFEDDADQDLGGDSDGVSWPDMNEAHRGSIHHRELEQGRKDRRESKMEGEEEEDGVPGEELRRKEALKVLCNVVYNSTWAQECFSALRWDFSVAIISCESGGKARLGHAAPLLSTSLFQADLRPPRAALLLRRFLGSLQCSLLRITTHLPRDCIAARALRSASAGDRSFFLWGFSRKTGP